MTTTASSPNLDALIETASAALAAAAARTEGATEDDACLEDEAECFRISPVHFAWYQLGETGVIGETKAIARVVIEAALKSLTEGATCACPEVDVTMPDGWRCPVHGAADQDVPA